MTVKTVTLGEVGSFQAGYGFPNMYQGLIEGDYPFAKVGDVSRFARAGKQYINSASNFVNKEILKEIKAKPVPAGTIVFAKIGEAIRQNFRAIAAVDMLIDNNTMGLIPNGKIVDTKYLYHYMCTVDLYRLTDATTVPALRKSTLEGIKIPLPPLEEQKRIVAILDKADAIRRKRQQAIDLTDQLLRSVFLDMFGDPVTNQKGWDVDKFGNNSSFSQGIQIDTEDQIKSPKVGFSKFLRIVNYTQNTKDFKYIPTPKSRKAFINEDDIVMVRYGATAGFVGGGLEGVLANNLFKIQYDKNIFNREYLFYVLKSEHFYSKLMEKRKGGAMPSISFGVISDMDIQIPPIDIQNEFAKIVNYYSKFKEKHNSAFESTKDLFGSLTQQAFCGELYKKIEAA